MKPPSVTPTLDAPWPTFCGCEYHTGRYLPVPETPEEEAIITAAEERWDDDFWTMDWQTQEPRLAGLERDRCRIPPWVLDLLGKVAT